MPLPPPWVVNPSGDGWLNQITQAVSLEHPWELFIRAKGIPPQSEEDGGVLLGRPPYEFGSDESRAVALVSDGASTRGLHWDFRCVWKELGLFGHVNSYGLTIRYFEDGRTVIKFDGLDGKWMFSQLLGSHGPLDRYDFFVGAKVRIFGRHLTISSTNASTCQWIDDEGKRLLKKQDWLQSRIESVGAVPAVRRNEPIGIKCNFTRKGNSGNADLRRIHSENTKLLEQLASLGMASTCAAYHA